MDESNGYGQISDGVPYRLNAQAFRVRQDVSGWPSSLAVPFPVLLGQGHSSPAVHVLDVFQGTLEDRYELPRGHSAYAVALHPEGNRAAVGTKGGRLLVGAPSGGSRASTQWSWTDFGDSEPFLDLAFGDGDCLLSSHASGCCYSWRFLDGAAIRKAIETGNERVLALCTSSGYGTWALTATGRILTWPRSWRYPETLAGPPPPGQLRALVRLRWWPAAKVLVYPCFGGGLAFIDPESREIKVVQAHQGDFYATLLRDDQLLTVGNEAALLNCWEPAASLPSQSVDAPAEVTSGTALASAECRMILVQEDGNAGIYELRDGELACITRVPVADCRVVVGPDPAWLQAAARARNEEEVARLVSEVQSADGRLSAYELLDRYSALERLGRRDLALRLQQNRAHTQGELSDAVRLGTELVSILSGDPEDAEDLFSLAGLMDRLWQPEEARALHDRIRQVAPDYPLDGSIERIAKLTHIMAAGDFYLETETPLPTLLEVATSLNRRHVGRYVLATLDPVTCCRPDLSGKQVADLFKQLTCRDALLGHTRIACGERWWIGERVQECLETIVFEEPKHPPEALIEFCLPLRHTVDETTIVPVVAFAGGRNDASISPGEYNGALSSRFAHLWKSRESTNRWIARLEKAVHRMFCQLNNEAQPDEFF